MGRRLVAAAAILWLLVPAAAVDPEARDPDLTVPGEITSIALAPDTLLVGTRDPGTLLTGGTPVGGNPDADVWHLFNGSGRAEMSGRADYESGASDCQDRLLDDCAGHVVGVGASADGNLLLVVSRIADSPVDTHRGIVHVIDRDAGVAARRFVDAPPVAAAMSTNGSMLAVLGDTQTLGGEAGSRLWTIQVADSGLEIVSIHDLPGAPRRLAMSSDGSQALVVADQAYRTFLGNTSYVAHGAASVADISDRGSYWGVTGAVDGNVRLVRQEADAPLYTRKPGSAVGAVAITPDGTRFAAGDDQGRVHLFARTVNDTGQPRGSIDLGDAGITHLAWSDDGLLLAAAAGDTVHLLQPSPTGPSRLWSDPMPAAVAALTVAADGQQVVAAAGNTVRVYEAKLDVTAAGASVTLQPRGEGNATVTYTNTGNRAATVELALRVPAGWNATLETTQLELPVGAAREVLVHLKAPSDGKPGRATVWVDHAFEGRIAGTPIQATVAEVRDLQMAPVGAQSAAISAGGGVRFRLEVENQGNIIEEIVLETESTPGWGAVLQEEAFPLAPGASRTLTIDLEAPQDAREGDEGQLRVTLPAPDGIQTVTFAAAVGARFGVDLSAPAQVPLLTDNLTRFFLEVTNTGNIVDNVRVSMPAANAPPGWIIQLENGLLELDASLGPGEVRRVEVVVQPPKDVPANGILTLVFDATSLGNPDRTDQARTALKSPGAETTSHDGAAWPWAILALGVLCAAGFRRARPQ